MDLGEWSDAGKRTPTCVRQGLLVSNRNTVVFESCILFAFVSRILVLKIKRISIDELILDLTTKILD